MYEDAAGRAGGAARGGALAVTTDRAQVSGTKDDAGKPRMDLLPFDAVEGVARVLGYGAAKYAPRNWEKGMVWGRLIAAALRHLFAFALGEDRDPESGLPHLDHAACCILFLSAYQKRGVGTDDRKEAP